MERESRRRSNKRGTRKKGGRCSRRRRRIKNGEISRITRTMSGRFKGVPSTDVIS